MAFHYKMKKRESKVAPEESEGGESKRAKTCKSDSPPDDLPPNCKKAFYNALWEMGDNLTEGKISKQEFQDFVNFQINFLYENKIFPKELYLRLKVVRFHLDNFSFWYQRDNCLKAIEVLQSMIKNNEKELLKQEDYMGQLRRAKTLPKDIGQDKRIRNDIGLNLYSCEKIETLPESIGDLTNLEKLGLAGCTSLVSLPESIGNLTFLRTLSLYECPSLQTIPESIRNLQSLTILDLTECTSLVSLPDSIGELSSLEQLVMTNCPANMSDELKSKLKTQGCIIIQE